MITIYNVKKSDEKNPKFLMELRGLSTDEKPTEYGNGKIGNGSAFIEINTGKVYLFDEVNQEWDEV